MELYREIIDTSDDKTAVENAKYAMQELMSWAWESMPLNLHPAGKVITSPFRYFAGDNIYDSYRQKHAIPDNTFLARKSPDPYVRRQAQKDSWEYFKNYMWQSTGMQNWWGDAPEFIIDLPFETALENQAWLIEEVPYIGPIVNRFARHSNVGLSQIHYEKDILPTEATRAGLAGPRWAAVKRAFEDPDEGGTRPSLVLKYLSDPETGNPNDPWLENWVTGLTDLTKQGGYYSKAEVKFGKATSTAYERALMNAKTQAERDAVEKESTQ